MSDRASFPAYIVLDEHSETLCFAARLSVDAVDAPDGTLSLSDLAQRWGFELLQASQRDSVESGALLASYRDQWQLQIAGSEAISCVDFSRPALLARLNRNNLPAEQVVRAVRGRLPAAAPLSVLDATAGFGVDATLLAAAGCEVTLLERMPFLADLLAQAVQRARSDDDTHLAAAAGRMQLRCGDSVALMCNWSAPPPEVIYLDPMYHLPQNSADTGRGLKKSAAIKKQMALLQCVTHGDDRLAENNEQLMHSALALAEKKVVVKRAPSAPYLAEKNPSSSLSGKAARFDIYAC